MKVYEIKLTARGSLTQLPDSQKVFGALVYMFSERYGSEEATKLTKAIVNKENGLALSNLYFFHPKIIYIRTASFPNVRWMEQENAKTVHQFHRRRKYYCGKRRSGKGGTICCVAFLQ